MEGFIRDLWFDMNAKIEIEKNENENFVQESIRIIEKSIDSIREFINVNDFKCDQEEINFFKYQKPKFCSLLIYYKKLHQIDLETPLGSKEEKKNHLNFHLNNLTRYFRQNIAFYQYIKSGKTHLDEQYFIRRNAKNNMLFETFSNDIDYRFCTGFDFRLAVLSAYEKLENYLNKELDILLNPSIYNQIPQNTHYETDYEKFNLHWTESQSALTELIYALHESKVFNEGETTILEITKCFEMAFNVRLSNVHRSFVEIKNRKNERLKFLDGLVNRLNSFIERSFQK